jgi:uncharacterized protein YqgV (UPF0045/DUF77 family)
MKITAELSLYPLQEDAIERIVAFINEMQIAAGLGSEEIEIVVNQLSTQVAGELGAVFALLEHALAHSFADGSSQVLVVKFLNADLPIAEPPDLGRAGG